VNEQTRDKIAQALLDAYRTGIAIEPPSAEHGLTAEDAYAVQLRQVEVWRAEGRTVKGHKVGLTSAAMQRQLKVDQPDYGHLMADMFHLEASDIPISGYLSPKIEPEIAFVLGRDLTGPGVTVADAISAVDFVLPSLEIIDSRIRDWRITLPDTIADNASSGGVVLGSRPTALSTVDLRLVGCVVDLGGEVVATGAGGAVLGSPINALVWLANKLGPLGLSLEAGSVVLPGSVCAAIPVAAGSAVTATFGGLGSVTARFTEEIS
jgi:2-keto-4-pentenoate hydratase